jgi:hypothetical protein
MKLLKEDVNEDIAKYKKLLNQSLAVKYRDEDFSYDKIRFTDGPVRGYDYIRGYITIPQCSIKNDSPKPNIIWFQLGKSEDVTRQLEQPTFRDKLVNEIKKRINEKFDIDQNTIEDIAKYKKLLNQSLAVKYRDEELSYENIKFTDRPIRGHNYIRGYITIPQCSIKNDPIKPLGLMFFHLGKSEDVIRQLEQPALRDKLVNEIKKRINERFDLAE